MPAYDSLHVHPDRLTTIRVSLPDGPLTGEWLHAEILGCGRFRIRNVPFSTPEVGLHDIVVAVEVDCEIDGCIEPECRTLELVEVVERVTRARFLFELHESSSARRVLDEAQRTGVAIECIAGHMYVANTRDRHAANRFQRLLERHASWFDLNDMAGPLPRVIAGDAA